MLRERLQDVIHIISIQREALDAPGPRDGYQGTVASVKDDVDDAGLFIAAPTLVVIIVLMLSVVLVLMAMSMLAFPFALIVIIIVVIMPVRPHAINDAFWSVVAGLNGRVLQAGKLCLVQLCGGIRPRLGAMGMEHLVSARHMVGVRMMVHRWRRTGKRASIQPR